MTNVSNILPGTSHVQLSWDVWGADVVSWLKKDDGRVDVYAYEGDDPLDHHHMLAICEGVVWMNTLTGSYAELSAWAGDVMACSDRHPTMLLAFQDSDRAVLCKLTWGGAQ